MAAELQVRRYEEKYLLAPAQAAALQNLLDGVLQREVRDTEIPAEDYEKTFRLFADGVMFWVKEKEAAFGGAHCCEAAVDVTDPETGGTDTYWLELEYGKAVTEWEHFLNKAMLE